MWHNKWKGKRLFKAAKSQIANGKSLKPLKCLNIQQVEGNTVQAWRNLCTAQNSFHSHIHPVVIIIKIKNMYKGVNIYFLRLLERIPVSVVKKIWSQQASHIFLLHSCFPLYYFIKWASGIMVTLYAHLWCGWWCGCSV